MKPKSKSSETNENAFRPKYCKAIVDRVCKLIADGLNLKQACQAAGISETSLLTWRKQHPDFADKVAAAREAMRAKVLAKIRAAGKDDWRALECFLRLSFAEYRFTNANQVNVAIQQNSMTVSDEQRAELIARRERALAAKSEAIDAATVDASSGARTVAREAERQLTQQNAGKPLAEPKRLQEKPPGTVVERADLQEERMRRDGWVSAEDSVDDILDG